MLGHPVAVAVELSLLGARSVPGEVFESRHRLGDLVGAGYLWLEALHEAAQRVRGDDDAPQIFLGDEPSEVWLGPGARS